MKILLILILLFSPIISVASELASREELISTSKTLFHTGEFEKLNEIGEIYLTTKERTSSGKWKFSLFYAGLKEIPNSDIPDPKYWNDLKSKIQDWSNIDSRVSFPHIMYADTLISQAWMYRGDGWGHEVRDEDWKPFRETIEEARKYLIQYEAIKTVDPNWYHSMITIAKAQSWTEKDFYLLIDEAFTNHPSFYPNYFNAILFLLPKWHGSVEKIENFAEYAVEKSRAIEGDGLYARIYWYASQAQFGHKLFTSSKANWRKMKLGIEDVISKYPDQWNINNFAVFACLAGDKEATKELMSMIEGRPIFGPWKSASFYNRCAHWSGLK